MPSLSDPFFFFNDTATTEIYTLSLHDALPIYWCRWCSPPARQSRCPWHRCTTLPVPHRTARRVYIFSYLIDRKSTRLNSSHANISYAVFCLKKKNKNGRNNSIVREVQSRDHVG